MIEEKQGEITSVESAIAAVKEIKGDCKERNFTNDTSNFLHMGNPKTFPFGFWFRGEHFTSSTRLTPWIFRPENGVCHRETGIVNHLESRNSELRGCSNIFEKLSLMQHYSIPTRLLDWSESFLVSLFFAASSDPKQDGALYVLNARSLNFETGLRAGHDNLHMANSYGVKFRCEMIHSRTYPEWIKRVESKYSEFDWNEIKESYKDESRDILMPDFDNPESPHNLEVIKQFCSPVAVMPNWLNSRMAPQNSVFTIHGGKFYNEDVYDEDIPRNFRIPSPMTFDEIPNSKKIVKQFIIPKDKKPIIKEEMYMMGIHDGLLFPELDKQLNYLNRLW